jgi:hypothetical protein
VPFPSAKFIKAKPVVLSRAQEYDLPVPPLTKEIVKRVEQEEDVEATDDDGPRPVYVSLEAHIEAHFLTCFVALLLTRILEQRMNQAKLPDTRDGAAPGALRTFSSFALIHSLRAYTCSYVGENCYNFHYTDDVIQSIEQVLGIDLSKKYRPLGDIKEIIATVKK